MGYIADVTVGGVNHPVGSSLYGTCDTAAGTAAKVVTMSNFDTLKTGVAIQVKFNNANTASTPTLNVGGTGAKNIFYKGSQITTDDTKSLLRGVCMFVYDGTQWCLTSGGNNVYTPGTGLTASGTALNHSNSVSAQNTQAIYPIKIDAQGHISAYGSAVSPITSHQTIKQDGITGATVNRFGTCSTAAGTAQKEVSITTGTFSLESGARLTVKFTNANTANSPTLKVGSTAAKNIFHGGSQITTGDNKSLLKGVCDFVYDGTQYHLLGYSSYSEIGIHDLPTGGSAGQVLKKSSATNYDASWATPHEVPSGGSVGQVLKKTSATDYDVSWGDAGGTYYGTCDTAANVGTKVVTCPSFTTLQEGATIRVKFTYGNSVYYEDGDPETYALMNVNNTGAKPIMLFTNAYISSGLIGSWNPGSIITFTYNGTAWVLNDYHNDRTAYAAGSGLSTEYLYTSDGVETRTFKHSNSVTAQNTQAVYPIKIDAQGHISSYGSAVTPITSHQTISQDGVSGATANRFGSCSTAAGTAAKTVSITSGTFSLTTGSQVTVRFTNANTATNPTLNVNSTGAKNIFYNGFQITTDDNIKLLKGACDFVYDGTQWHLIGSSVSDVLYVTFTYNNSTNKRESDVTYAEMQAALQAGKCVIGKYGDDIYFVSGWSVNGTITFARTYVAYYGVYMYYLNVTSSSISYNYNQMSKPQINFSESFYEIVYDSDQNKYVLWGTAGDMYSPENILESDYACSYYAILLGGTIIDGNYDYSSSSSTNFMEDAEFFYLNKIDYDPNFEYESYGDEYQGACVLIFNNADNSKTITLKMGLYDWESESYGVTVTNNSSGGGVLVTFSNSGGSITSDKTLAEVVTALNNGENVYAKYDGRYYYPTLWGNTNVFFHSWNSNASSDIDYYKIVFTSSSISLYHTGKDLPKQTSCFFTVNYSSSTQSYSLNQGVEGRQFNSPQSLLNSSYQDTNFYVRLNGYTSGQTEMFYLEAIWDDPNFVWQWYGNNQTGGVALKFKNASKTKTMVIKLGYTDIYFSTPEVTVTDEYPVAPSTNGTYILKCVVSNGTPTYSWEAMQQGSGVQF